MFSESVSFIPQSEIVDSPEADGEVILPEGQDTEEPKEEVVEPDKDDVSPEKAEDEGEVAPEVAPDVEVDSKIEGEKEPKDGARKRIDKITKRWRDTERENFKLKAGFDTERDALQQRILELETKTVTAEKPIANDYTTTEEYIEALVEYKTSTGMDKIKSDAKLNTVQVNAQAKHERLEAMLSKGPEAHPDFDEVVRSSDLPINTDMVSICSELNSAADVLYYLGKNPSECADIAKLPPVQMAIKLAGIEHSVSQPPTKKASRTPAPITPIASKGKGAAKSLTKMSNAEYRAKRGFAF